MNECKNKELLDEQKTEMKFRSRPVIALPIIVAPGPES